ncbi:MAG: hypothetical protein IPL46_13600 [Saprospiraceae bacterium]|nr:hypothetical protein [Saprospiraceae bacterium]
MEIGRMQGPDIDEGDRQEKNGNWKPIVAMDLFRRNTVIGDMENLENWKNGNRKPIVAMDLFRRTTLMGEMVKLEEWKNGNQS